MMYLRNKEERNLTFFQDSGEKMLEWVFLADELAWVFYGDEPIEITEESCDFLYKGLQTIMDSSYIFSNPFSKQEKDKIEWFSDQTCDLEDEVQTDRIARLVIERRGTSFFLSAYTPFFQKNDIKRPRMVAFSPGGNGSYSRNKKKIGSFQTDISLLFTMNFEESKEECAKLQMKKEEK